MFGATNLESEYEKEYKYNWLHESIAKKRNTNLNLDARKIRFFVLQFSFYVLDFPSQFCVLANEILGVWNWKLSVKGVKRKLFWVVLKKMVMGW